MKTAPAEGGGAEVGLNAATEEDLKKYRNYNSSL